MKEKDTHQSIKAGAKEEKDFNSQEWKHKIKVTKLKNRELTMKSKRVNTRGKQTEKRKTIELVREYAHRFFFQMSFVSSLQDNITVLWPKFIVVCCL